jgi:hypothetical protein
MTTKFEVGKTYWTRSIVDHDSIHAFEILGRTEQTVTIQVNGASRLRRLYVYEGVEQFKPHGSYSMCAIIGADKVRA